MQITRMFFYLVAALWLAAGIGFIARNDGQIMYPIMAGLMFAAASVFIALGANLTKRTVYWLGGAALAACVILTIFDDFGFADLIALVLFTIPLVIMLTKRKEFLASQEKQ